MNQNSRQWIMESKIGKIFLIASEAGLTGLYWKKKDVPLTPSLREKTQVARILAQAVRELEEYFRGTRKTFTVPIAPSAGTPFQHSVWSELKKIPYGKTVSYRDIARRLKNEKAMRAVGTANGKNPISIIVPCHRVIAADGTLGGYAGGMDIKEMLLRIEGIC